MPRYFTHYWSTAVCDEMYEGDWEGYALEHSTGEDFTSAGIVPGDAVYVVSVMKGHVYLIGRMYVSDILFSSEEAEDLLGFEIPEGDQHLIAEEDRATPMSFTRELDVGTVMQLLFLSDEGPKPLKVSPHGLVDRQALRGIRELDATSATLLESVIEETDRNAQEPVEEIMDREMDAILERSTDEERNALVRKKAIEFVTAELTVDGKATVTPAPGGEAGYDLLYRRKRKESHLRVIGTPEAEVSFILQEWDFRNADHDDLWELIVVSDALSRTPRLHRFNADAMYDAFDIRPVRYAMRLREDWEGF